MAFTAEAVERAEAVAAGVVDAAIHVHRRLGPGLLESTNVACLAHVLQRRGHRVDVQVPVRLSFDDLRFERAFRMDMLVDDLVVVEVKTTEFVAKAHVAQIRTYVRLAEKPIGLLLNFDAAPLKYGIRRVTHPELDEV